MTFDLDAVSEEALELQEVLAYAAGFAASPPGRSALQDARPIADAAALAAEHAANDEAGRYAERFGRLIPAALPDPAPARGTLGIEGHVVDPVALRDLASLLAEAADLGKRLGRLDAGEFPSLQALSHGISDLGALTRDVVRFVGPDGRLEDDASAELRRLRVAIVKAGERLRRQLEAFLHDPSAASVVRDDFVTQRNGRFVIPVRADAPRPVEGIVHAASSSGQTLFVEPIASVATNNELVRLAEQEAAEALRIVRGWTESYRARLPEIDAAIAGLARADVVQARAAFARAIRGTTPRLAPSEPLRLDAVRHPLLDRRIRCIPITVAIDPYDRVLVVSGPNTGGKTVALKTVGLAVLMAQCGLPVAADEATLPIFRQLRADIGDHQSIAADLSTFSGHVRAVVRFLDEAAAPALFLFDEIGTGTEPGEGAALAQAVLERLLDLEITAIATTHHAALKAWAFSDPRVQSAAMEFDEETLKPTYRVLAGAAGSSAGIDVASRLGLEASLVARARALVGAGVRAEEYMARLRALTSEAEEKTGSLREAEARLAAERERLEKKAAAEASERREATAKTLDAALREFRQQSKKELAGIQDAKERAKAERAQFRAESRLRAEARRIAPAAPVAAGPLTIAPGARVRIISLEREGEIVAVRGEKIDVRMGAATFLVSKADLAAAGQEAAPAPEKKSKIASLIASRRPSSDERPEGPPLELHLLGKTVDEALPEVDKFLDACAREGRDEVRIVHGHGTGRLRVGVRAHLKAHPLVASFRPGGTGEGGDGATVVTLR
ncbi:MAG TPA: Smr/MutS family protein [Candidatus Polarisedimenticolaceae bacterium]|nr:Smr/MutS family protein [Candidatus Polarisedimenticolaceae bacterium]